MINSSIKVVLSVLWVKNPQLFKFLSQNLSIIENLIFSNEILTIFTQCVKRILPQIGRFGDQMETFQNACHKIQWPENI